MDGQALSIDLIFCHSFIFANYYISIRKNNRVNDIASDFSYLDDLCFAPALCSA